jgi:nitrous oxidase accessory protein
MKRKMLPLEIISVILISLVAGISFMVTKANPIIYCPQFIINSDGSITPPTEYLAKTGDTYYLTSNTSGCAFIIRFTNMTLYGQGYVIDGGVSGIGYSNVGLLLDGVSNVTVRDFTIKDFWADNIELANCSNCNLLNVQSLGNQPVTLRESSHNSITQNKISDLEIMDDSSNNLITRNKLEVLYVLGYQNIINRNTVTKYFFPTACSNNLFYENNFYHIGALDLSANRWDNGSVGNYWHDYNGSDVNGDGIGDTSYIIDANNKDNYPLMEQTSNLNPSIPNPSQSVLPTTSPTPSPTPALSQIPLQTPSPSSSPTIQPTLDPTKPIQSLPSENYASIIIVSGLAAIVAIFCVLVYLKKRNGLPDQLDKG